MLALLAAALVVLASCGGGDDSDSDDGGSGGSATTTAPASCGQQAGEGQLTGSKKYDAPPPMTIDQEKQYIATIKMDIGDIKLELFAKDAPCHVNSFVFLSREGFYDGVVWHRVVPGFVAQTGDPTGTGRGGPGYTINLEVNANKFEDGSVGAARSQDRNSAGSQFFIDYSAQPGLDGDYTVFGKLTEGRDVLNLIAPGEPPSTPTVINTIEIEER
jgi:cyclophilin family peptidyl-prolyl cis-trans isomerase